MDWVAALIGAAVGAVVTILGTLFTTRFNYRQLFAETVSKSRSNWMNGIQDHISNMLAIVISSKYKQTESRKYYENKYKVLLYLNLKEPLHLMLHKEILQLDNCKNDDEFKIIEQNILDLSKSIFKIEWNRL